MLLSRRTHTHTQLKSEHDKVHSQLRLRPPLLERSLPFLRVGARRCSASMTASDGRAPSTRPWRRKPLWGRCLACGERALHTAAQALAKAKHATETKFIQACTAPDGDGVASCSGARAAKSLDISTHLPGRGGGGSTQRSRAAGAGPVCGTAAHHREALSARSRVLQDALVRPCHSCIWASRRARGLRAPSRLTDARPSRTSGGPWRQG